MIDSVILVMLQIVHSLPHNKVSPAEPHLLSQYMNVNTLNQIASLLVR